MICISFDWKFDFKFSQINGFEILWNRLCKILKITIGGFRFRSIFEMSHIDDSYAWFYEIFISFNKITHNYDQCKIS